MLQFDIRRFDIYRKIPKDLTQPTLAGAFISIFCVTFITLLLLTEFFSFIITDIASELYVANPGTDDRIQVRVNVSLPKMPCKYLGVDIQDEMGRHEVGFEENTVKTPLNNDLGCLFQGSFTINKVPGNFHLSTHGAEKQPDNPDMTHYVHEVVFGEDIASLIEYHSIPHSFNALEDENRLTSQGLASHDYIMRIVPTEYEPLYGEHKLSYQYTYAHKMYLAYGHGHRVIPAIWFRYDISPITVRYSERRKPFYTFLTTICAVVGGTFTVAGIIDSCIFTASEIFKKFQLGKIS